MIAVIGRIQQYDKDNIQFNGELVSGYLTILSFDYGDIKEGYYISNYNNPFAYKVNPDSVYMMGDNVQLLLRGHS